MIASPRPCPRRALPAVAGFLGLGALTVSLALPARSTAAEDRVADRFAEVVQPTLEIYCYACHGLGATKGDVALDGIDADPARLRDPELWLSVLKNVRAGVMPPAGEPRPSEEELRDLEAWIEVDAFGLDPEHPDPGRVTVRRLNRVEYRNTVRDLIGVDYRTDAEFPADDSGHGFDNIGDVLTISPLLMEKYLDAAREIIGQAVPTSPGVVPEQVIPGGRFRTAGQGEKVDGRDGPLVLSYYEPATASKVLKATHDGRYELVVSLTAQERYVDGVPDLNRCRLVLKVDDEEELREEFSRQPGKDYTFEIGADWKAGDHMLAFELEPVAPGSDQARSLTLRLDRVAVRGPLGEEHLVRPKGYDRFFPRPVPQDAAGRRQYARELLEPFATRAFRRPVGEETLSRLLDLAEFVYGDQGEPFESGISQAMTAVLASPRFLFREEDLLEPEPGQVYPLVDEYALASRLSYFLWSTMPDEELFRLAGEGKLRENLPAQLDRMLADRRANEFVRQFTGQWLQARDIESVPINAFAVVGRDQPADADAEARRDRFRRLFRKPREELTDEEKAELDKARAEFRALREKFQQVELSGDLRRAMRRETEMLFSHVLREDRSLLDLIDSNYTFLNERLARHYGIEGVEGDEMRRVDLPPGSPRGGVLTQGTFLAVTSNPDRTSPVKRGLFVLENLLGTPPPPPPPDIPPLEDSDKAFGGRTPTLRETLALHRERAMCASCHDRMDPIGLGLENFNALGIFREAERGGPIDASGELVTGEAFEGVEQLKQILAVERRQDFYRCVAEKMLTYALGRGLDYRDVPEVDRLVGLLEREGGRASVLLTGIVEGAPFQRSRRPGEPQADLTTERETSGGPGDRAAGPETETVAGDDR